MTYVASGIVLDTNLRLPELGQAGGSNAADCSFHLLPEQKRPFAPTSWIFERTLADGRPWLSIGRHEGNYLLRFPGLSDFLVTENGRAIKCVPVPGIPVATIRHLLLDQVLPLVLTTFGRLVLHAGAVELDGRALVFLGPSGAGKSTLVGAVCQQSAAVVADDCVVVEHREGTPWAVPSYAGLRLWPSSVSALFESGSVSESVAHYTEKRRVSPNDEQLPHAERPVPIQSIYLLDPIESSDSGNGERAAITPLGRRDACMALVRSAFQLDVSDPKATCRSFERVGELASSCAVSRLQYVQDFAHLPTVVTAVLEDQLLRPGSPCSGSCSMS